MDKKIIFLVILFSVAVLAGVWIFVYSRSFEVPPLEPVVTALEQYVKPNKEEIIVGYDWSTKEDTKEAVGEVVSSVLTEFEGESPDYAILFWTEGYDPQEIADELRLLLPETKLHGGTSMLAVFSDKGYHLGQKDVISLLAVSSPHITFGVGGADVGQLSAEEAGEQAVLAAIKNAGREGEVPKIVHIVGSAPNEEGLLLGIEKVVGEGVPIIGGSACDNAGAGNWRQLANDQVYTNGVALTVFFSDLNIGWAYEGGYEKTQYRGVITKAEGRTIYEIDNEPSLDVYDEWTGGIVSRATEGVEEELVINLQDTAFYPLAKVITGELGAVDYLTMNPYAWHLKEGAITTGIVVEEGDVLTLVQGTWEINLNHCKTIPAKALTAGNIRKGKGYFALYTYCFGKMLSIPEEEKPKMPLMVNSALGNVPFIAANTCGEQGFLKGIGNRHGNLASSIIIFGPAE